MTATTSGLWLFALLTGLAFLIQWMAFIPSYLLQTEKFFDLTGSITYITLAIFAIVLSPTFGTRSVLLLALVVIWATRLGAFLFWRIQKTGKDGRFDRIKPSFYRFLGVWTLQGLWVLLTLSAALAAILMPVREPLGLPALIGTLLWVAGFAVEVVADVQKSRFRADPANRGEFIDSGLWSLSRHPNYVGEIVLWVGVAIIAAPTLQQWQWLSLLSPLFVVILLTRISGIPILEQRADEKWGGRDDYEAYKRNTPVLFPWPRALSPTRVFSYSNNHEQADS